MPARQLVALVAFGCAVFAGCGDDNSEEEFRPIAEKFFARPTKPRPGQKGNYVARVRLRMQSFQLPAARRGEAESIWRRLDTGPLGHRTQRVLALNGIRAGVARTDTWKDFVKMLEGLSGKALTSAVQTLHSIREPAAIALDRFHEEKTLFAFHPDGTLVGADHLPGGNELGVYCTLRSQNPVRIDMTLMPQIRSTGSSLKYRFREGSKRFATVRPEKLHSFLPLALRLTLSGKEFLVLGPDPDANDETSVGCHFFVRRPNGIRHETLLVVAPEVFHLTVPETPGQPGRPGAPGSAGTFRPPVSGGVAPGTGRRPIRRVPPKNGRPPQAGGK